MALKTFQFPLSCLILGYGANAEKTYSEDLALDYVRFSSIAYCDTDLIEDWNCKACTANVTQRAVCQGDAMKSFVGLWDGKCLISHEGTKGGEIAPWIANIDFIKDLTNWDECEGCKVHGGFLDQWYSVKDCVMSHLESIGCAANDATSPLYITGHSLGGAITGVSMMALHQYGWHIAEGYTFGMPRVGDPTFAARFDELFGDRFFRVTHHKDPVPHVPTINYEHVYGEIFYDGDGTGVFEKCSTAEDHSCSLQYDTIFCLSHVSDHLTYLGRPIGSAGCHYADVLV